MKWIEPPPDPEIGLAGVWELGSKLVVSSCVPESGDVRMKSQPCWPGPGVRSGSLWKLLHVPSAFVPFLSQLTVEPATALDAPSATATASIIVSRAANSGHLRFIWFLPLS